ENKQLVFQWRTWDYFDILDAVNLDFTASVFDVTHINSIDLTTDSNIIISVRVFDEITKINRNTGDIIWRLGGLNNEFTFLNDTAGFNRQHDARWHSGNTLTLFDNGVFHVPVESSAKEYAIDEGVKTAELIWQYSHPNHIYGPKLGNVQRLDNGNTLINWGGNMEAGDPALTEVLPDCTIVFELYFENNYHVLYRGFKFPWNNPCDTIMKLPPQIMNDAVMAKLVFYPNPAQDMVFMRPEDLSVSIESYAVYDIFGRMAACEKNPGKGVDGAYPLTTAGFSDGMYIVSCRSEGKVYQGRFCISR
ncbi:MAG: arylsulfotransferase family protein, partial [Bacteroidota bacterium]